MRMLSDTTRRSLYEKSCGLSWNFAPLVYADSLCCASCKMNYLKFDIFVRKFSVLVAITVTCEGFRAAQFKDI